LFGGLASPEIPFWWYVTAMDRTEDEVRRQAAEGVRRGFGTMYLKIGFDHESDLALTSAIRDEVGPTVAVRVDVNEGWTVAEALSQLPAYGELGVDFVEEPIDSENLDGMASLRSRTGIPIGANQSAWLSRDAWRVIRMQSADVIVSDHHQVGGLQAFRDLAAVCRAAGLPLVRHAFGDLGVTTAAGLHVLGTMPSPHLAHQQYLQLAEHQLLAEPLVFEQGSLNLPSGPGLGVELDRDALEHYAELYRRFGETAQYGHGPPNRIPPEHTLGTAQALI
jgi:L-alanine-DL-glutamate epimerase-like enolase superfamily enzyme